METGIRQRASKKSLGQKILILGIFIINLKIDRLYKKRTRQNSECQITRFVRFLYLGLDFCPRLLLRVLLETIK